MAYEQERAERDFRQNPPTNAPGQGNDDDWGDIAVGSSSAESMSDVNASPDINNVLNGQQSQLPQAGNMQQNQMKTPQDQIEELAIKAAISSGKGIVSYLKYLIESVRNNTEKDWHDLGITISKISIVYIGVSVLIGIFDKFSGNGKDSWDLAMGATLSLLVGVLLMGNFSGKGKSGKEEKKEEIPDIEPEPEPESYPEEVYDEYDPEEDNSFIEEDYGEESSAWDDILDDDYVLEEDYEEEDGSSVESSEFDVSNAVDSLPEIQQGTQTRQYLFETFMKVLPKVTPGFAVMNEISDESDEFYEFEGYLIGAADQVGTKEGSVPELRSLYENEFIYRLNCTRPVGIKEQLIADEIAKTYSRDSNNMEIRTGVYATVETSVGVYTVNLFKGMPKNRQNKGITISLGDIYRNEKDFMLDPSIQMPFVWGVNEFGKAWVCDLIDNNSIIISGEPRGGKSWKGQSIVAQLCMFNSPKEIEFYIFDGKDRASDYRYLSTVLPHVKYFCGDQDKITDGIERVLNKAVSERDKILSSEGYISIKDYNRDHPTEKLPYMYVVLDEMMSLMEYFKSKDKKDEMNRLKGLLSTMVSKLAYAGVRFILFPHRIVDDVIPKNTYSLVSCRAVVCQPNMDALKAAVDVTNKTFPYAIVQKGDMALKTKEIENGKVVFCHAEILTSSNETNKKLFDYIGAVWSKLEPSCKCITISGSIGGSVSGSSVESVSLVKPAVDHTEGKAVYQYSGFDDNTNDIQDDEELVLFGDGEVDESYWNNF